MSNPIPQCGNLIRLQGLTFRRHPFGSIRRRDTIQQQTRPGITRDDRGPRLTTLDGQHRRIKPQATFLLQNSVTRNASLDENRLDVLAVVDLFIGKERR